MSWKINKKDLERLSFFFILILAIFLRFSRLYHLFPFTIDEEYHVNLALSFLQNPHPKLVGVSVSVGFYLGPLWTYLTAALLWLSHNNPFSLALFAATLGVVTTATLTWVGKNLFGSKVALIAGFLYACLPLIVFYDQKYWNDSPIPLLAVLLLFSLAKSWMNTKWLVLTALCFGLVFHTHLSLLPLLLPAIFIIWQVRKKVSSKTLVAALVVFLVWLSPLAVFYLRQGIDPKQSFKPPQSFQDQSYSSSLIRHSQVLFNFFGRFWWLNLGTYNADENNWGCSSLSMAGIPKKIDQFSTRTTPPIFISGLSLLIFGYFLLKPTKNKSVKLLKSFLSLELLANLLFPGGALEYYLLAALPLLCLAVGVILEPFRKWMVLGFLSIIAVYSGLVILQAKADFGLQAKKLLIEKTSNFLGAKSYRLETYGGCQEYGGWRYLFSTFGKKPAQASTDATFSWIYPSEIDSRLPDLKVLVVESRLPHGVKNPLYVESVGGYTAYITY